MTEKEKEKINELEEFIKNNKQDSKTNEEFFEENRQYFEKFNLKNYSDLEKLINAHDKENIEEDNEKNKKMTIEHIKNNDLIIQPKIKFFDNLSITLSLPDNNNYIHIESSNNNFETLEICKQDIKIKR